MTPKHTAAIAFISSIQKAIPHFREDHEAASVHYESHKQNIAKGDQISVEINLTQAVQRFGTDIENPWGNGDVQDFLVASMHAELPKPTVEVLKEAAFILSETVGGDAKQFRDNWPR